MRVWTFGRLRDEIGGKRAESSKLKARKSEDKKGRRVRSGTRRRPIRQDYGAAIDAAFDKLRRDKFGKKEGGKSRGY